jgi:class 3 adenylate cyclase
MDVAAWLRGLGLERYEPTFRDNEIDWEVLPKLTSEDLREIGVAAIGHRRKLLDAIAALGASVPGTSGTTAPRDAPAPAEAERRQLTVMFCDLVGSTALSARLDPEDLREVIAAYHRAVTEVVAGFDGIVAKYMGDGVLAYFGYPRAHEDDAERATRAGLDVIDAVGRLDVKSVNLQARVGIATGLVVVGDLIGEGSAQEQSVVGETPNLAARLQALAEPKAVVIAQGTRRLVGDLFEYRDLGAVEVKGLVAPVPAWQVLRTSVVASRFEALRGAALASPRVCRSGRGKRCPVMEGLRNDEPGQRIGLDGKGFGRDGSANLWDCCLAENGSETMDAVPFAAFGTRPCGTRAIRGGLALHRRSNDSGRNNQGDVVQGGDPPNRRRNRADVAEARRGEGAGAFRESHRHCPRAKGEVLGIARGDEPGPAVARSQQTAAGPRSSRAGLRLVHRGLRYRRSKRGQGAARRTAWACDCRKGMSPVRTAGFQPIRSPAGAVVKVGFGSRPCEKSLS